MPIEEFVRKVYASADANDIRVDSSLVSRAMTRDADTPARSIIRADWKVTG
jgi:hypothetical protein